MQKRFKKITIKLKAGVVVRSRGRVLLIRELNNRTGRYGWNIIKGTFEPGKDRNIMETALREAREEAHAKVKLRHVLGIYYLLDGCDSLTTFVFVADLINVRIRVANKKKQATHRAGEDIIEVRLFTRDQLKKLRPADFVGMRGFFAIQHYLNGKRFSLKLLKVLSPK